MFETKGSPDRAVTHAFAGMLYDSDNSVGRLLDALERLGISDSTYVIFMADNGGRGTIPGALNSLSAPNRPLNGAKHTLYEGGIRVPFLVADPAVEPNSASHVPVTGYDLLPTLYALAGGREPLPAESMAVASAMCCRTEGQGTWSGASKDWSSTDRCTGPCRHPRSTAGASSSCLSTQVRGNRRKSSCLICQAMWASRTVSALRCRKRRLS